MESVVIPDDELDREIARLMAIGYSWAETAKVAGCSEKTVERRQKRLAPYVRALKEDLARVAETGIYANLALAIDVERRMLTGEIPAKEERYQEARAIVRRFTDRIFIVDRGPALPAPGPADTAEPGQLQLAAPSGEPPASSA